MSDASKELKRLRSLVRTLKRERDEAREIVDEQEVCWMMDRCHACGHRLRFSASGCPQCNTNAVAPWHEPNKMPDKCKCDRCVEARARLTKGKPHAKR